MKYSYLVEFESDKESVSEFLSQAMNNMLDNARRNIGIKNGHCWVQDQPCKSNWGAAKNNTQQTKTTIAISAIKGALRIVNLWLPKTASVEHAEEARALHKMHSAFLSVVQKQHH